jgi:hypothetical protein
MLLFKPSLIINTNNSNKLILQENINVSMVQGIQQQVDRMTAPSESSASPAIRFDDWRELRHRTSSCPTAFSLFPSTSTSLHLHSPTPSRTSTLRDDIHSALTLAPSLLHSPDHLRQATSSTPRQLPSQWPTRKSRKATKVCISFSLRSRTLFELRQAIATLLFTS